MDKSVFTTVEAYLSRVVLPQEMFKDRHGVHRLFWRAFPGKPEGAVQPFLFREEPFAPVDPGEVAYSVQSGERPAWDVLLGLRVVSCERVETEFTADDRFYFRLLASPVRRLMSPDDIRQRGHVEIKRTPPRQWVQIWFDRRAQQAGFEPLELIFDLGKVRVARQDQSFKLQAVQFDGLLKVTDPERFAMAWRGGIGPKKAFGFGLLSLRRAG